MYLTFFNVNVPEYITISLPHEVDLLRRLKLNDTFPTRLYKEAETNVRMYVRVAQRPMWSLLNSGSWHGKHLEFKDLIAFPR